MAAHKFMQLKQCHVNANYPYNAYSLVPEVIHMHVHGHIFMHSSFSASQVTYVMGCIRFGGKQDNKNCCYKGRSE